MLHKVYLNTISDKLRYLKTLCLCDCFKYMFYPGGWQYYIEYRRLRHLALIWSL